MRTLCYLVFEHRVVQRLSSPLCDSRSCCRCGGATAELASYFAQYTRTPWFRELTNKSVISLQLAGLQDMLERPGEMEKFLEEMRRESGEEVEDVESLKKYMTRVVEGEVPMSVRRSLDELPSRGQASNRSCAMFPAY
jgi:hypothetical protein